MNLVSDTVGDGIPPSARSRGLSKPEKPTQDTPARKECPWPSRRRNRWLCICHGFLTRDAFPLHAWYSRSFVDSSDTKLGQFTLQLR